MKLFKIVASTLLFASIFSITPQTSFGVMSTISKAFTKCIDCLPSLPSLAFWRRSSAVAPNNHPVVPQHAAAAAAPAAAAAAAAPAMDISQKVAAGNASSLEIALKTHGSLSDDTIAQCCELWEQYRNYHSDIDVAPNPGTTTTTVYHRTNRKTMAITEKGGRKKIKFLIAKANEEHPTIYQLGDSQTFTTAPDVVVPGYPDLTPENALIQILQGKGPRGNGLQGRGFDSATNIDNCLACFGEVIRHSRNPAVVPNRARQKSKSVFRYQSDAVGFRAIRQGDQEPWGMIMNNNTMFMFGKRNDIVQASIRVRLEPRQP